MTIKSSLHFVGRKNKDPLSLSHSLTLSLSLTLTHTHTHTHTHTIFLIYLFAFVVCVVWSVGKLLGGDKKWRFRDRWSFFSLFLSKLPSNFSHTAFLINLIFSTFVKIVHWPKKQISFKLWMEWDKVVQAWASSTLEASFLSVGSQPDEI